MIGPSESSLCLYKEALGLRNTTTKLIRFTPSSATKLCPYTLSNPLYKSPNLPKVAINPTIKSRSSNPNPRVSFKRQSISQSQSIQSNRATEGSRCFLSGVRKNTSRGFDASAGTSIQRDYSVVTSIHQPNGLGLDLRALTLSLYSLALRHGITCKGTKPKEESITLISSYSTLHDHVSTSIIIWLSPPSC
ncbi:hypothetical protein RHMOL_Rhmol11G0026800 [Rhododendron molle]|uniref:Uncharacterized protein n=1 Tax=Rhododendron molle TaxID=49168 RepID=A0ACC0LMR4_RHOML|nr:hypothetical protein RHMOL_Rhmol11G0026800 [Rhododendron molle]